jgi:dTDP-glucose 4,6-dehydratase
VYGNGENIRDWIYVDDHVRAIDLIFHEGFIGDTYNIGGSNERKNIDLIREIINIADNLLDRPVGSSLKLINYVLDRPGHDFRYAIDSSKINKELGWKALANFDEDIKKTVSWYIEKFK